MGGARLIWAGYGGTGFSKSICADDDYLYVISLVGSNSVIEIMTSVGEVVRSTTVNDGKVNDCSVVRDALILVGKLNGKWSLWALNKSTLAPMFFLQTVDGEAVAVTVKDNIMYIVGNELLGDGKVTVRVEKWSLEERPNLITSYTLIPQPYEEALRAHGLSIDNDRLWVVGDYTEKYSPSKWLIAVFSTDTLNPTMLIRANKYGSAYAVVFIKDSVYVAGSNGIIKLASDGATLANADLRAVIKGLVHINNELFAIGNEDFLVSGIFLTEDLKVTNRVYIVLRGDRLQVMNNPPSVKTRYQIELGNYDKTMVTGGVMYLTFNARESSLAGQNSKWVLTALILGEHVTSGKDKLKIYSNTVMSIWRKSNVTPKDLESLRQIMPNTRSVPWLYAYSAMTYIRHYIKLNKNASEVLADAMQLLNDLHHDLLRKLVTLYINIIVARGLIRRNASLANTLIRKSEELLGEIERYVFSDALSEDLKHDENLLNFTLRLGSTKPEDVLRDFITRMRAYWHYTRGLIDVKRAFTTEDENLLLSAERDFDKSIVLFKRLGVKEPIIERINVHAITKFLFNNNVGALYDELRRAWKHYAPMKPSITSARVLAHEIVTLALMNKDWERLLTEDELTHLLFLAKNDLYYILTWLTLRLISKTSSLPPPRSDVLNSLRNHLLLPLPIPSSESECPTKTSNLRDVCLNAISARNGDENATNKLRNYAKALGINKELMGRLSPEEIYELFAPKSSRVRFLLTLYALANKKHELAQAHAAAGVTLHNDARWIYRGLLNALSSTGGKINDTVKISIVKAYYAFTLPNIW